MQTLSKTYTQIMSNKNAGNMQKLFDQNAEIMQHISQRYAKHMQEHMQKTFNKVCRHIWTRIIICKQYTNMCKKDVKI